MPSTKHEVFAVTQLQARSREVAWEELQNLPREKRLHQMHKVAIAERIGWNPILDEFSFAGVIHWAKGQVPWRVLGQLVNQVIDTGMVVTWHNRKYLVVHLEVHHRELFQRFTLNHLTARHRAMTIVPLKYFDLNA